MADTEQQIERWRLGWEANGSLTEISNQATDATIAILSAIVGWLRQSGEGLPAFETVFARGRWSRRA